MSLFLTNPDDPKARKKIKGNADYSIALEKELKALGVPHDKAIVATIDHKSDWIPFFKKGLHPQRAAELMLPIVKRSYHLD